jgi:hypothetical protein
MAYLAKDHDDAGIDLDPRSPRHVDIDHRGRRLQSKAPHPVFICEAGPMEVHRYHGCRARPLLEFRTHVLITFPGLRVCRSLRASTAIRSPGLVQLT